jgi:hypothetical protein
MTFPTFKKDSKPPDVLRLRADGTMYCADGSDVTARLKAYVEAVGVTNEIPICLIHRDALAPLWEAAWIGSNTAA